MTPMTWEDELRAGLDDDIAKHRHCHTLVVDAIRALAAETGIEPLLIDSYPSTLRPCLHFGHVEVRAVPMLGQLHLGTRDAVVFRLVIPPWAVRGNAAFTDAVALIRKYARNQPTAAETAPAGIPVIWDGKL